ncbi:hypothetical protein, partial [Staphylococcus aureus]|uniref:hypothetical protein n=1 Tax=Staphylococcus aureus TaxID=1280 RepID=UPI003C7B5ABC
YLDMIDKTCNTHAFFVHSLSALHNLSTLMGQLILDNYCILVMEVKEDEFDSVAPVVILEDYQRVPST